MHAIFQHVNDQLYIHICCQLALWYLHVCGYSYLYRYIGDIYIYIYSKEFVIVDILKGGTIVMKLGKRHDTQPKKLNWNIIMLLIKL